jgi:hypothetical protein
MKRYDDFINEQIGITGSTEGVDKDMRDMIENRSFRQENGFTLNEIAQKWGDLDPILLEVGKRTKNKIVFFTPFREKKMIKIKVKEVYYKRFIEGKRLGNFWFFVDDEDKEYQLSTISSIFPFSRINKVDPYGEEDWEID